MSMRVLAAALLCAAALAAPVAAAADDATGGALAPAETTAGPASTGVGGGTAAPSEPARTQPPASAPARTPSATRIGAPTAATSNARTAPVARPTAKMEEPMPGGSGDGVDRAPSVVDPSAPASTEPQGDSSGPPVTGEALATAFLLGGLLLVLGAGGTALARRRRLPS